MEPDQTWTTYCGTQTPLDFMRQYHTADVSAAADRFVAGVPQLFGIVLQGTWEKTFRQDVQYSVESLRGAVAGHLEATRAEWEEALADSLANSPQPVVAREIAAPEETALPQDTGYAMDNAAAGLIDAPVDQEPPPQA